MAWQPIETAPKDGEAILLFSPTEGISVCGWGPACFMGKYESWVCYAGDSMAIQYEDEFETNYRIIDDPTHWMPLPEPPGG